MTTEGGVGNGKSSVGIVSMQLMENFLNFDCSFVIEKPAHK